MKIPEQQNLFSLLIIGLFVCSVMEAQEREKVDMYYLDGYHGGVKAHGRKSSMREAFQIMKQLPDWKASATTRLVLHEPREIAGVVFAPSGEPVPGVNVWLRSDGWFVRRRPFVTIRRRWAVAALALFLAAFAVWIPSRSGGALCDPDSWIQGHAVWHLLCAAAAGCLFVYFLSEDTSISPVVPGVA